jgi:hypothetical protein
LWTSFVRLKHLIDHFDLWWHGGLRLFGSVACLVGLVLLVVGNGVEASGPFSSKYPNWNWDSPR